MARSFSRIAIYSISHFAVDFACAFFMFRFASSSPSWMLCMLLYNFFAFAMQMPLGLFADYWNKNALFAAIGCIAVALSYALSYTPLFAVCLLGIGNGMFHIGGGIDILNLSGSKSGPLGVFVSPGAFGIYFGTLLGKQEGVHAWLPLLLVGAAAFTLLLLYKYFYAQTATNAAFSVHIEGHAFIKAAVLCLFLVVCLRSFVGMTLAFPWKGQAHWGAALICAVVFGKALGGIVCDKIGAFAASALSLSISALLFMLSSIPVAGVAAVFFFNMTMPITLFAITRIFHNAKGFSFGMLTFALFLGFLPSYMGFDSSILTQYAFALASMLSLALLLLGLKGAKL